MHTDRGTRWPLPGMRSGPRRGPLTELCPRLPERLPESPPRVLRRFTETIALWITFFKEVSWLSQMGLGGTKRGKKKTVEIKWWPKTVCWEFYEGLYCNMDANRGRNNYENDSGMARTHRHMPEVVLLFIYWNA